MRGQGEAGSAEEREYEGEEEARESILTLRRPSGSARGE